MIRIILVLSLAAVALGAPQHHSSLGLSHGLQGPHASQATTFSSGAVATEGVTATLHGRANAYPESRSAWTATTGAAGLPGLTTEAKLAPAGRAAWSHDAHLNGEAQTGHHILEQQYEMEQPGSYLYSYKTSNGIEAQERAALKAEDAEAVEGTYSWVAPSGERFAVEYVADETGYHARGAHIAEIPAAIARSLEWNAAHPEEEGGAAAWQGSERASYGPSGRAAWMSKSSANVPTWESSAKIETSRIGSASGRSTWNTGIPASAGASKTIKTTTYAEGSTLKQPAFTTYTTSGLAPAARSAWASDATATGFTGTGATQVTKITETKPAFTTYTASGLAPAARSAWASDATATGFTGAGFTGTGFTGAGFTGTGATQITKITETTETKPAFATYTASSLAPAALLA